MVCGKVTELKLLNDRLHKDNIAKDREIRQLNKDLQQNEQTIMSLRNELCLTKCRAQESKKDVEVTAGCYAAASNNGDVISLRMTNVSLHKELRMLRGVSAALASEVREIKQRNDFKDEIIKELRIQLKRAKTQNVGTCTHGFRCSTPLPCVDRGQCMDISLVDKCTSISEILPCTRCKPAHSQCCKPATATKCTQAVIPIQYVHSNDIDEIFFNDGLKCCKSKPGRCGCASGNQLKPLSCTSLTSKGYPKSVSFCDGGGRESCSRSSNGNNSPSGSCASARAQYFHNKLLATMQILKNKEETVRVQAESLAVAETRIANLTARTVELKKEIEKKCRAIECLQDSIENCRTRKCDASVNVDVQSTDKQEDIVKTLQNNLSVIEDLYRECFYETAKQEGIIEMLRKSYLDVRLVEREKSDQITKLNNIIDTQKWSLDRCQDIASEVDDLKIEITNFLNNANNDSGVWEESADGVIEDLQDINQQLLLLRELLTGDCTCGLKEENTRLKQNNECLQKQVCDNREHIDELENILENKDAADRHFEQQIVKKEQELNSIRQRLAVLEAETQQCCEACGTSTKKFKEAEALLQNKCTELCQVQSKCKHYEEALKTIRNEVAKYECLEKEIYSVREENKELQKTVRSLKSQLIQAQRHACSLEECCRQQSIRAQELESELSEAGARGAELCDAARRAVHTVRTWAALLRNQHQQQCEVLQQKEQQLRCLRNRLARSETCRTCPSSFTVRDRCNDTKLQSASDTEQHMSACTFNRDRYSDGKIQSESEMPCYSKCVTSDSCRSNGGERQKYAGGICASAKECFSLPTPQSLLKKIICRKKDICEAYVQRPLRSDATSCTAGNATTIPCDMATTCSPCDATTRSSCDAPTSSQRDTPTCSHRDTTRRRPCDVPSSGPCDATRRRPCDTPRCSPSETPRRSPCETKRCSPCDEIRLRPCDTPSRNPCDATRRSPCDEIKLRQCNTPSRNPCDATKRSMCDTTRHSPCFAIRHSPCDVTRRNGCDVSRRSPCHAMRRSPRDTLRRPTCLASKRVSCDATRLSPCEPPSRGPCDATNLNPCDVIKLNPCDTPNRPLCVASKRIPCDTRSRSPCGVPSRSPCDVTRESPCDTTRPSACDVTRRSSCDETRLSPCGSTRSSACDATRSSTCDVTRRKSCDSTKRRSCIKSPDLRYCAVQQRPLSPSPYCEKVFSRMEGTGAALPAAVRRWRRAHGPGPPPHDDNSG